MANRLLFISLALFAIFTHSLAQNHTDSCSPSDPPCDSAQYLTCVDRYEIGKPGTCLCQAGTVHNGTHCVTQAGFQCNNNAPQYCVPNANCGITCDCIPGGYEKKPLKATGELFCLGTLNAYCKTQDDCDKTLACTPTDPLDPDGVSRCKCETGRVWDNTREKCLITPRIDGEPIHYCSEDNDCIDNAICNLQSGACNCLFDNGFEHDETHLQCRNSFGQNCTSTSECNEHKGLVCGDSKTCNCPANELYFPEINGRCRKLAGGICNISSIPSDCAGGSTCHADGSTGPYTCFCDLSAGKIELPNRRCGDVTGTLHGHCKSTDNCGLGEYLNCTIEAGEEIGICACESGMEETSEGCRHLAGKECKMNHGCVKNAACIDQRCECRLGYSQTSDNFCLKTFGSSCSTADHDCNHEEGLDCDSSWCACPGGQRWSAEKNHCVALVSGNCTETNDLCTEHAQCTDRGICVCDPGYSVRFRHRADTPDDGFRICLPTHNQTCDATADWPCNDEEFLTCNPDTSRCACEYPSQQEWDSSINSCASLPGGFCGTLSELDSAGHVGQREMKCLGFQTCETDEAQMIGKCSCNAGYSVPTEEGGDSQCRRASGGLSSMTGLSFTSMVSFLGLYAVMGKIVA